MKAAAVVEGRALSFGDYPDPVAGPGEVVVELRAAAINRRDLLLRNPPGPAYQFDLPVIPGSDGAGIRRDTGEEVVIYPGLHWGPRQDAAGPDWRILGGPDDGTYAELVKVLQVKDVRDALFNQGLQVTSSSPEEFAAFIAAESARWSRAVKASGATVD